MVLQAGAEKKVTFDWGPAGSKAEDCFFGIMALDQGYSFNFIQVGSKVYRYMAIVVLPCSVNLMQVLPSPDPGSGRNIPDPQHWVFEDKTLKNYIMLLNFFPHKLEYYGTGIFFIKLQKRTFKLQKAPALKSEHLANQKLKISFLFCTFESNFSLPGSWNWFQ